MPRFLRLLRRVFGCISKLRKDQHFFVRVGFCQEFEQRFQFGIPGRVPVAGIYQHAGKRLGVFEQVFFQGIVEIGRREPLEAGGILPGDRSGTRVRPCGGRGFQGVFRGRQEAVFGVHFFGGGGIIDVPFGIGIAQRRIQGGYILGADGEGEVVLDGV